MYSTVVSVPVGALHGLEFGVQTCPTTAFPFGTPSTFQVTLAFEVPVTVAVNSWPAPAGTTADVGDTATAIDGLFTIVTNAGAFCVPATALIVTGFAEGTTAGAVYIAEFAPVAVTVPTVELPPTVPFTSHVTVVPSATQSDAEKVCVAPATMLTVPGEMEFAAAHEIVTLAVAAFDESAMLVAVTETTAGAGGIAGAVYAAASGALTLSVPTVAFPPLMPLTLQFTPELWLPAPVTVAVKLSAVPGETLAELGAMLTVILL